MLSLMLSDDDTITVTVSASRDSYRSVEHRPTAVAADVAECGGQRYDEGLRLVDSRLDEELVDHRTYLFEGTAIAGAPGT